MSERGRKRKRSESTDSKASRLQSDPIPPQLSSPQFELPKFEEQPPQPVTSTTPTSPTVPLTRANLRAYDPTMDPSTPTSSKKSAMSETSVGNSTTVKGMKHLLSLHQYLIEDAEAKRRYDGFIKDAKDEVTGDRHSAMAPGSKDRIEETYDRTKDPNELTFFTEYWGELINKCRLVDPEGAETGARPVSRPWVSDHIQAIRDQGFREDSIPEIPATNAEEKRLLELISKVQRPKPDMTYGLLPRMWCTPEQISLIHTYGRHTMPTHDLVLPYFIVEGKSGGGNMEETKCQASRGGAALNAAFRRLDTLAGTVVKTLGPDQRSYVFSLCLNPSTARLYLHWVDVQKATVVYHMHSLRLYDVQNRDDWADIRRDVDNVLDWGAFKRKNRVLEMLTAILKTPPAKRVLAVKEIDAAEERQKKMKLDTGEGVSSSSGPSE